MLSTQSTGLTGPPNDSVVRVLEWHSLPLGATYLLLVPLSVDHDGMAACEGHLLAPRTDDAHRARRFRYGASDFRLDVGELALIDVLEFAREWAEGSLEQDLLAWVKSQPLGTQYPDPPRFRLATTTIAGMWLAQWEAPTLKAVRDRTGSAPLRDYLDKLFRIPPVAVQKL